MLVNLTRIEVGNVFDLEDIWRNARFQQTSCFADGVPLLSAINLNGTVQPVIGNEETFLGTTSYRSKLYPNSCSSSHIVIGFKEEKHCFSRRGEIENILVVRAVPCDSTSVSRNSHEINFPSFWYFHSHFPVFSTDREIVQQYAVDQAVENAWPLLKEWVGSPSLASMLRDSLKQKEIAETCFSHGEEPKKSNRFYGRLSVKNREYV